MQMDWKKEAAALLEPLHNLVLGALALEKAFVNELAEVNPERMNSARNLIHYLSLRQTPLS